MFQQQLQSLLETHVYDHEQSMLQFVERVASVCETKDSMDGHSMALAIRGLRGIRAPKNLSRPSPAQTEDFEAAPLKRLFQADSSMSMAPPDTAPRPTPPPARRSSLNLGRDGPGHVAPSTNAIDDDLDPSTLTTFQKEFAVERCAFISDAGEIIMPKGEILKILPQKWKDRIARNSARFSQFMSVPPKGCLSHVIKHSWFKIASVMAIFMNYFFIIAQTDFKMQHPNEEDPILYRLIDLFFTCYYTLEVTITLAALRVRFFFGYEAGWNWFDLIIVFFSVLQEVCTLLHISAIDTSFLRILRFMRISKVLRMFEAMRMFKEVKIMIDSLQGSFMVFAWCVMLFGLYLSVFAIFFVQGMSSKVEDGGLPAPTLEAIERDFSSVTAAMQSLFMALTGGNDWAQYHETIFECGQIYTSLFFFFILFALMAFFNVVTGVFCEKAMSLARPGPYENFLRKRAGEVREAKEVIALLKQHMGVKIDANKIQPPLNLDQMEAFLAVPEVVAFYGMHGMTCASARRYFEVLAEVGGTKEIDFPSFVSACVKLDASASAVDLHVLSVEVKSIQIGLANTRQHISSCQRELKEIHQELLEHVRVLAQGPGKNRSPRGLSALQFQPPPNSFPLPPRDQSNSDFVASGVDGFPTMGIPMLASTPLDQPRPDGVISPVQMTPRPEASYGRPQSYPEPYPPATQPHPMSNSRAEEDAGPVTYHAV